VHDFGIDLEKVKEFLRRKRETRQEELQRRLEQAQADAARIRRRLIAEIDPKRIYQWGSLVHTQRFSEISDIDFALEGLPGQAEFFHALGIAMDETDFPVDIVELEKLDAATRDEIERRGRLVYEREH
jgi:predicted nucleotidyltransferase